MKRVISELSPRVVTPLILERLILRAPSNEGPRSHTCLALVVWDACLHLITLRRAANYAVEITARICR